MRRKLYARIYLVGIPENPINAKAKNPERWSGSTRNWTPEEIVYLNPGKPTNRGKELKQQAA